MLLWLASQLLMFTLASGTLLWNWALTPLSTTDFGERVGYKPTKLSKARYNSNDLDPSLKPNTVSTTFATEFLTYNNRRHVFWSLLIIMIVHVDRKMRLWLRSWEMWGPPVRFWEF